MTHFEPARREFEQREQEAKSGGRTLGIFATGAVLLILAASAILFGPLRERAGIWVANNVRGIGGPFMLQTSDGQPFGREQLLGRPHIVYFGFTYCPDLCPTTLYQLASVMSKLGPAADRERMTVVFVSVDPERDKPDVLKEYLTAFDQRMVALTGSAEAIREAANAYGVFYRKVPLEGGGYTMDHSSTALLFTADGTLLETIPYDETDDVAAEKVARLLEASS